MQNRFIYALCIVLTLSDLLIINWSFIVASELSEAISKPLPFNYQRNAHVNANLIWLISSSIFQLYNKSNIKNIEQIYRRTWKSLVLHVILVILFVSVYENIVLPSTFTLIFYTTCVICFILSRFACTLIETILIKRYKTRKPVAVLGLNQMGLRLASFFEMNKKQYSFKGFLDSEGSMFVDKAGNLLPAASEQLRIAAEKNIKEVYVSLTAERISEAGFLLQEAERQCINLKFVPDFSKSLSTPFRINYLGEFPVINLRNEPLEDIDNRFKKRLLDIIFSSFIIIFILSWLFPIIAIAIKMSKGPVLFKQLRSGRDNQVFYCYKFRSMRMNRECDTIQATKCDDRVTRVGRFLRRTSLDELPQFFNVLLGDMSVAGPRPHMLKHTEEYRAIIDKYMVRHHLKPGITGWAQVNGLRGETNTKDLMEKRVEHDIWYIQNWTMMLDIKIIFLTVINLINGKDDAY